MSIYTLVGDNQDKLKIDLSEVVAYKVDPANNRRTKLYLRNGLDFIAHMSYPDFEELLLKQRG